MKQGEHRSMVGRYFNDEIGQVCRVVANAQTIDQTDLPSRS
jgi:hypothetical protein